MREDECQVCWQEVVGLHAQFVRVRRTVAEAEIRSHISEMISFLATKNAQWGEIDRAFSNFVLDGVNRLNRELERRGLKRQPLKAEANLFARPEAGTEVEEAEERNAVGSWFHAAKYLRYLGRTGPRNTRKDAKE